jgi:heterodisulfide reductase subunit C
MVVTVNLTKMEENAVQEVIELGGEGIIRCIQCGACSSICPIAMAGMELYNKKLFKKLLSGYREEIIEDPSPWACVACNRCVEICPRDVKPFQVVFAFRRLQAREFAMPMTVLGSLKSLYEKGHAVYSEAGEIRKKLGLPEVPPSTLADPKALEEVQILLKNSEIAKMGVIPMG